MIDEKFTVRQSANVRAISYPIDGADSIENCDDDKIEEKRSEQIVDKIELGRHC